jgi:hypothetical protein
MTGSILWRRLDQEGHEAARLIARPSAWLLCGTAVFVSDGAPCRLEYRVTCDRSWVTLGATVEGWMGDTAIDVSIDIDAERRWRLNGEEFPAVRGCRDLDLSFSPSTKLLPLRRLVLATGEVADVRAAWLRFPALVLEPLEQRYQRLDATQYHYESNRGRFVAEFSVRDDSFVTDYPGLWRAVTGEAEPVLTRAVGDEGGVTAPGSLNKLVREEPA